MLQSEIDLRLYFNPLPHAEGDGCAWTSSPWLSDFNPLPHAEGDFLISSMSPFSRISIHSLTQRETINRFSEHVYNNKFQSTPSRRGRRYIYNRLPICHNFNPLPHAEGDISCVLLALPHTDFNPLPHAEGDLQVHSYSSASQLFQSTPSRRGRRTR